MSLSLHGVPFIRYSVSPLLKIRLATVEKVPYQLVVGPRDEAAGQVSARSRADGDLGAMALAAFVERLAGELKA